MTLRRKGVKILLHLGHSISNHTTQQIETQWATSLSDQTALTPEDIKRAPNLITRLAWENCFASILKFCKPFGICYQNKDNTTTYQTECNFKKWDDSIQHRKR